MPGTGQSAHIAVFSLIARSPLSLIIGVYMSTRPTGIGELSSLVNFGAMAAFLLLHVSVVVHYVIRRRSRNWLAHLVVPVVGIVVLVAVVLNQSVYAQWAGGIWLAVGLLVLGISYALGRRPALPSEV